MQSNDFVRNCIEVAYVQVNTRLSRRERYFTETCITGCKYVETIMPCH